MGSQRAVAHRFGANLLAAREGANVSQEELGLRASLHRTEIGLLERGARIPRIDTLVKLASALDVSLVCPLLDGIAWEPGRVEPGRFGSSAASGGDETEIALRDPDLR